MVTVQVVEDWTSFFNDLGLNPTWSRASLKNVSLHSIVNNLISGALISKGVLVRQKVVLRQVVFGLLRLKLRG